jgi:radical SAM protein with 4Fe4S-binding SPASM domain
MPCWSSCKDVAHIGSPALGTDRLDLTDLLEISDLLLQQGAFRFRVDGWSMSPALQIEWSEDKDDRDEASFQLEEKTEFGPPADDRLFRCGCGTTAVHISAWGKLGACTWAKEPRADLRKTSVAGGIAEIFPRIRDARYQTETKCRSCPVHQLCDKDMNIAWAEAGNPEQPVEHFCQTAFTRAAQLKARMPSTPPSGGTRD